MSSPPISGFRHDAFPDIRDYAPIGDCRTVALVARSGSIEWLCLPNIDSPSLFAAMLDRDRGGHFSVAMSGASAVSRRYRDHTNVLETTFSGPGGEVRLTDFMPVTEADRLDPEREVIRIVECTKGHAEIAIDIEPRPEYGRGKVRFEDRRRNGWVVRDGAAHHHIRSDVPLERTGRQGLAGRVLLEAGESRTMVLSIATRDPAVIPLYESAGDKLAETVDWWRGWMRRCTYEGAYAGPVRRSLLTLKLLDFVLSGAVVAAATTSLPESVGAGRNWDYRFCWLRDASFVLRAFTDTGFAAEGLAFFEWLMHTTRRTRPEIKTLYDVFGRDSAHERELTQFGGYRGSRPVRIGNAAKDQLQLDVYGAVVNAAADALDRGSALLPDELNLLAEIGALVCRQWRLPDDGIWEMRGRRQHNTHSKVMCWAALNDLIVLADRGVLTIPRETFVAERDAIRAEVMTRAFNERIGAFVGAYDADYVDATALLMPRAGIIAADDPRMLGTWKRIAERLDRNGWIDRYEAGTDGMAGQEGAFGICSFWAVDYLARAGRLDEAKARLDRLVKSASDLGLYAEEIDPASGAFLGNFPQAYTHTGLINAVQTLERVQSGRNPDRSRQGEAGVGREARDMQRAG